MPPSSSESTVGIGLTIATFGFFLIGIGAGLGIGVGLVVVVFLFDDLVGLGVGLKVMLGSKMGAVGCFWGIDCCSFLPFDGLGVIFSSGIRIGENGIVGELGEIGGVAA